MKTTKIVALILVIATVFCGCSFRISSSVDELISPISPFGDNADIKNAMDEFAAKGYSLKTPHNGDYIAAYSFYDLDGDGTDEALAFYEPYDNLGTVNMAVISRSDKKWKVIENTQGMGVDVYSLNFADVDGDGASEIIVCWDTISNSTNHELAIYEFGSAGKLRCFYDDLTVNNYIAVDMVGDKTPELLMFELNSGDYSSAKAELYSFKNKKAKFISETKLDSHITSYVNITIETVDGKNRVYADAIGSNGTSMLTEILRWSTGYDAIISPYYNYQTGLTSDSTRSIMITSRDIDGDGRLEVPIDDKSVKKLPKDVACLNWRVYDDGPMLHVGYSLVPKNDGYLVNIPDSIISDITVKYNSKQKLMTVRSKGDKKEIFSVLPVLKATYSKSKFSEYQVMFEEKGYYYLAKTGDSGKIKITSNELKTMIKSVNGEEKL